MEGQNCRIGKVWSKKDIYNIHQVVLIINKKNEDYLDSFKERFDNILNERINYLNQRPDEQNKSN